MDLVSRVTQVDTSNWRTPGVMVKAGRDACQYSRHDD